MESAEQLPVHGPGCSGHYHADDHADSDASPSSDRSSDTHHSGEDPCSDPGCQSIAVKPVESKLQLSFSMGIIVDAVTADVVRSDSRRISPLATAAPWKAASERMRALTQTWLL